MFEDWNDAGWAQKYGRRPDAGQIERKQMRLAMSVDSNHHYRIGEIQTKRSIQRGEVADLSRQLVRNVVGDVAARMDGVPVSLEAELAADFPQALHDSASAGGT